VIRLGGIARRIVVAGAGDETPPAPFALELDDGTVVRVELAPDLLLVDGDDSRLEAGMHVELLADDDAEYAFEEAIGHREAPAKRLVRVTARALARGEDAGEAIERARETLASRARGDTTPTTTPTPTRRGRGAGQRRPELRAIPAYALALVAAGLLVTAGWLRFSPLTVDVASVGIACLAGAGSVWTHARRPRFVRGQQTLTPPKKRGELGYPIFIASCLLGGWMYFFFADLDGQGHRIRPNLAAVNTSITALGTVAVLLVVLFVELQRAALREEQRLLRTLLDASPLAANGQLRATWGSVEGVVRDPTPVTVEGEAAAMVHVTDQRTRSGDSYPAIVVERMLTHGTFFIDTETRTDFEVHTKAAVWTSTVERRMTTTDADDRQTSTVMQLIPVGGSILVAARALRSKKARTGKLAPTGEESRVLLATDAGRSARGVANERLAARSIGVGIVLLCAGALIALGALAEPRLPPFHLSSDKENRR
jgi:hypothetical protein